MLIIDFLDQFDVLAEVPGCPSATARKATVNVARQFFTESQVWNEIQEAIALVPEQREYPIAAPDGAKLIDIKAVYAPWLIYGQLRGTNITQLAQEMPQWDVQQGSLPTHYTRAFDFGSIAMYPLPVDPGEQQVRVHAVYTIADDATTLDDEMVSRYGQVLAAGVKSRLMLMPKAVASWNEPNLGAFHKRIFDAGLVSAKVDAAHSQTTGDIYVPPRRFGR